MSRAFTQFFQGGKSVLRILRLSSVTLLAGALLTPALWNAVAAADPAITLYDTPQNGLPYDIAQGADGNAWFTYDATYNAIGRITANGTITNYTLPTPGAEPFSITTGPDGKAWFTERAADKIGNIDTSGNITEVATLPSGHSPTAITTGPDGNLWFADSSPSGSGPLNIGKLTPGGTLTEYPVASGLSSYDITTGPDGALWFAASASFGSDAIGRIATDGTVTLHSVPTSSGVHGIAAGPDGNLWFTEVGNNKIGRMTTAGYITEYAVPTPSSLPYFITNGPDGALWFGENSSGKLARITTAGSISEYVVNKPSADVSGIQTFSDGTMWFAGNNDVIGHVVLPPAAPVVHVTNPAASSTVSGTVNIAGTIDSPANYSLMLYVFNSSSQAVVSRYQYNLPMSATTTSYNWDTTTVPNGNYTIILSAKDSNGHKDNGSTSTVHITVQN